MKIKLKIPKGLYAHMLEDLKRPHSFAFERVGFAYSTTTIVDEDTVIISLKDYQPVKDECYIETDEVGAKFNADSIRDAMQICLDKQWGGFHVHLHNHKGLPFPSKDDEQGLPSVIESLTNVAADQACGVLILSKDSFYASVVVKGTVHWVEPELISVIGYPMKFQFCNKKSYLDEDRASRQSFLGEDSECLLSEVRVGIVGLGGGGSHMAQQLAHIGVRNITVFDDDVIEMSNLNRLIGAQHNDIKNKEFKVAIASRLIKSILPQANVTEIKARWQERCEELQKCDIILGCVDTYLARQQLEAECRRFLIPFIDIGMDVFESNDCAYHMSGQVILSMPGMASMKSMGFLTDEKLAAEAAKYGNAGGRPQVVWPNGVLASSAIGVLIDLLTGWSKECDKLVYLSYDGNSGTVNPHIRLNFIDPDLSEYDLRDAGRVVFTKM